MGKQQIERFRSLLLTERNRREYSLNEDKIGLGASVKDDTGELSSYDNHPGDLGSETFEAEKNFSFRNNDKYIIGEIDNAIKKIDDGSYGICERCKKNMDVERLEIIPYARFCIECEQYYRDNLRSEEKGRPIEEQVISPPFGRSFRDDAMDDSVEYDGEDAWQAVNIYNVITSDNPLSQDDSMGYVEDVESISNEKYKKQLE